MPSENPRIGAAIIGTQRGGTSSLAAALERHPQICLAKGKEAHLFDQRAVQVDGLDPSKVEDFFAHREPGQVLLDATPIYLYLPGCLEALKHHNPDVKVIAVLREPAERARSHHSLEMGRGWEDLDFKKAIKAEPQRLASETDPFRERSEFRVHSYADRGRYTEQVRRCLALFPDALFLRFDEVVREPEATLRACFAHFGVDPDHDTGAFEKRNAWRQGTRTRTEARLARSFAADSRRTEHLLGWAPGSLDLARAPE